MLHDCLILIAEDQAFIALELAMAVEDAGGVVAGPVASVQSALLLIKAHQITAAILDFNLTDGEVLPVASLLFAANIPFIIQSGIGLTPELAARFPNVTVHIKPSVAADLVAELGVLIAARGAQKNVN
jgi:DNA-binding NtrC family response regulator